LSILRCDCTTIDQLLAFGKDFPPISTFVPPLRGCPCREPLAHQITLRSTTTIQIYSALPRAALALALGWYVTPRWDFCSFAAVDMVDGVDVVDGGGLNFALSAFCRCMAIP